MSKDNSRNKGQNKSIPKINFIQIDNLRKSYRQEFERLSVESFKIESLDERINWWINRKAEFLLNLPTEIKDSSGYTIKNSSLSGELLLDEFISIEIDRLRKIIELNEFRSAKEIEVLSIEDIQFNNLMIECSGEVQKVALLIEMGVFDYVRDKYKLVDNSPKHKKLISELSGLKYEIVRKCYGDYKNPKGQGKNNPMTNKSYDYINSIFNAIGIER